jgi:hypothetical protein
MSEKENWRYFLIRVKFPCGNEYDLIRYGSSLVDAISHAYQGVEGCEVISGRPATEFEIEGKHKGAYLL